MLIMTSDIINLKLMRLILDIIEPQMERRDWSDSFVYVTIFIILFIINFNDVHGTVVIKGVV